jgi:hypothetical protein
MGTAPQGWQTPKTDWTTEDPVGNGDLNRIEQNIKSIELENRTIDDAQTPSSDTGFLRSFLDWFANRIKAIIGKTNWYDAPSISLEATYTHTQDNNKHLTTGAQTIAGDKTFSNKIIDKNGNEVIAMLVETKTKDGGTVAAGSVADVDVTGFSWTPDAILDVSCFSYASGDEDQGHGVSLFGGGQGIDEPWIEIVKATVGTSKVTVRLANRHGSVAQYYKLTVTAAKSTA